MLNAQIQLLTLLDGGHDFFEQPATFYAQAMGRDVSDAPLRVGQPLVVVNAQQG
ncbi:MAG: hypothetical protein THHGLFOP_001317, partial [Candidatus Fervidibacter sp.]